ncbi:unnamed protein product [Alopecurus aequalis]
MKNSRGVVYGDGTVFLYNFSESDLNRKDLDDFELIESTTFRAAILAPSDVAWKFVMTKLDMWMEEEDFESNNFLATYRVHDSRTLVHLDGHAWHLLPPPAGKSNDKCKVISEGEDLNDDWRVEATHVLESRGEMLRVSVVIKRDKYHDFRWKRGARQAQAVLVHAQEEEVDANGVHKVWWATRDGLSFTDRVMFLGFPTSFAVESSRFRDVEDDLSGGCVYFVQRRSINLRGMFRYNLVDRKAKFMGRLPPEWNQRKNEAFLWLLPQPSIAPIQVIRERLEPPRTGDLPRNISSMRMEKPPPHYKVPFVSFVVWNLPPGLDSSRLRCFFNKHGKVSDAKVTSPRKGSVTMAIATSYEQYEAEDVLDGLVLDGYTLKVSKAKIRVRLPAKKD